MKHLIDPFTRHPASVGETYGEHLKAASSFGWRMMWSGAACVVHSVLPFCFVNTASDMVTRLHEQMVVKRRRGR